MGIFVAKNERGKSPFDGGHSWVENSLMTSLLFLPNFMLAMTAIFSCTAIPRLKEVVKIPIRCPGILMTPIFTPFTFSRPNMKDCCTKDKPYEFSVNYTWINLAISITFELILFAIFGVTDFGSAAEFAGVAGFFFSLIAGGFIILQMVLSIIFLCLGGSKRQGCCWRCCCCLCSDNCFPLMDPHQLHI